MPYALEQLHSKVGLQLATHVWGTTVGSLALIAAPSTGKRIVLRYISIGASAPGSVRITTGTTAGTTYYVYTGGNTLAFQEMALIPLDEATAATLHTTAGGGNGFIRAYYSIELVAGSGLTQ